MPHITAEIIAVGSELTSGARLDTNSQWLSRELAAVGIPVRYHTTVADELESMIAVFRAAVARSDMVLITGGLGPTLDDLTRVAMAGLLDDDDAASDDDPPHDDSPGLQRGEWGGKLVLDEASLDHIRSIFARRGRPMPERNIVQALFPEGSEPITNPCGTAPGIWMVVPRDGSETPCRLAALPGVPSEMKRMFRHEVLPRLTGTGRVIRTASVRCFGRGESDIEAMLGDLTERGRQPEVGITVHEATITLRLVAQGSTAEECEAQIRATETEIRRRLGDLVFGTDDEELEHVVVRMLIERKATLSTAESGTGGLLAHRLTDADGFERCFPGGVVVPTEAAKRELLGIEGGGVSSADPVSAEVAAAMARACRQRFGTDFALAVTECPRFDPEAAGPAAPVAYVALASEQGTETREQRLAGDPAIIRSRVAKAALNLLRLHLLHNASAETSGQR